MSIESAIQQDTPKLAGDLHTMPKPERRLHNQDTYSLEWVLPHCGGDRLLVISWIREIQTLLDAELSSANPALDAYLVDKMGSSQFRSRPDFQRGKIAIEQWVPSMDCWMVNGYFIHETPWDLIITILQAGDPRRQTAEDALAERRLQAEAVRARNEAAGSDRVLAAVDAMSDKQVRQFVEVEQALQSGDRVTAMGQDGHTMDVLVSDTKRAASLGDKEAQSVLTRGQQDTSACILPSTNPLRHRHRSELHPHLVEKERN